jgi:hypothetical protein
VHGGGDGAAKEDGHDAVVHGGGLIFVKREEDEGLVVVEVGVFEKGDKPKLEPLGDIFDVGVVGVVDEIRGDEDPLGDGGRVGVDGEVVEITVERGAGGDSGDRVEDDERVVLSRVVGVRWCGCVEVVVRGEASAKWLAQGGRRTTGTHLKPVKPSVGMFSW